MRVVGAEQSHVTAITWLDQVLAGPRFARWRLHQSDALSQYQFELMGVAANDQSTDQTQQLRVEKRLATVAHW